MGFLKKLFGKKSEDTRSDAQSAYVVVDQSPEAAKKQVKEILQIMNRIVEAHRGEYVVMHTMVTQALVSRCRDDVLTVQHAFASPSHEDVVDLGMIDYRSFQHLSQSALGNEGVVALAIHGKFPLNAGYDYSSNWRFKKQPMVFSVKEVNEISQKLSRLDVKRFCKEHAIPRSDVWILKKLAERYRQAAENDLAMVVTCRSVG